MVIFYVLDIVIPFLMIGEMYTADVGTPFCNQSTETHLSTCCLCPPNASCDLACPGEWKKIRGNEVQCPHQNINHDKLNSTDEYDMYNNYDVANYIGDGESSLMPNDTLSLDNHSSGVYCVVECPVGTFYEHQDLNCQPCDPSCKACNGPNATGCTECEFETDNVCMKECLPGWVPIIDRKGSRRGTVCTIRVADDDERLKQVLIAVVIFVALIVVVVVIIVCLVKRRRGRTGNGKLVQTKNKRAKPNRPVRGENYLDAAGIADEETPFTTGNTEDANYHVYHDIAENTTEVKYDYAYGEREGDRQKPESEEGYELIDGDANHDIHVDEDIYEEMGVSSTCKSPTPRAGQEPFLSSVAKCARIDIGKKELGVSTATDISNKDNDRKSVDKSTINTAGNHSNERLTGGDDGKATAHPTEDYLIPISGTAKYVSTSGTIDKINSNDDITQIQTEQTHESILGDGTEGEVYTNVTDNKGCPIDMATASKEPDSAKQLHLATMGLQQASNKNEAKLGNSESDDITGRKPKLKPKPLPKPKIHKLQPNVASETGVVPAVKPASETVPDISTDVGVLPQRRHFQPIPLPRKQTTLSESSVKDDTQMTEQDSGPGKKEITKDVSDCKEKDIKKAQSCKTEFPDTPDTARSDIHKDKFQHTGQYTDVLSVDDLKDVSTDNPVYEEPSSEIDPSDISLPKCVSLSFSDEDIKEILLDT